MCTSTLNHLMPLYFSLCIHIIKSKSLTIIY